MGDGSQAMLTALHIQNFVLIEQARLALGPGLTALTGETGAGKSILLDALGLAVGGRSERGVLRQGADQGLISATFEVGADHPVWSVLKENALPSDDDAVILRRVQTRDGKSRAFVNDQPVGIALLRAVGEQLLEIHGQHDGRGFLTASTHRATLDEFGALRKETDAVAALFRARREVEARLEERLKGRERARADADYLRHIVAELESLDPQADEEARLAARRAELVAAERVGGELAEAAHFLSADGLESKLAAAARRIARASAQAGGGALDVAVERINAALAECEEARAAIESAVRRFGYDPAEQARVEERLFALRAAARKHAVAPDALPDFLRKAQAALDGLDAGEAGLGALEREAAAAARAYDEAARRLSAARRKAAAALDEAVARELGALKLGRAAFSTRIETDAERPTTEGVDQVEFMVATNPGAPAGPLKTIASGGELSRFVLAMKAALAAKERRTVIIFDEVDAGVGGAVADAVGERLARLARDAQVLVVTHSPQVAARAETHWRIEKSQGARDTLTRVAVLTAEERVEEIARMLSGKAVTEEARAAARSLLGEATRPRAARRKTA
jgi:DNA repair protein RecN (Recombination protein N)